MTTPHPLCYTTPMYKGDLPDIPHVDLGTIDVLGDRHRHIIRLRLLGLASREISEIVGCDMRLVELVLSSEMGKERLGELEALSTAESIDVAERIQAALPRAVQLLSDMVAGEMDGASPSLRMRAASELLDRGGFGKVSKVQAEVATARLTMEDIAEIKARAKSNGRSTGNVVPAVEITPLSGREDRK